MGRTSISFRDQNKLTGVLNPNARRSHMTKIPTSFRISSKTNKKKMITMKNKSLCANL